VVEQLVGILRADEFECFHWATHAGAELDFLHVRGAPRIGFEIKRTIAPKLIKPMRSALKNLKLNILYVVHAEEHSYPLQKGFPPFQPEASKNSRYRSHCRHNASVS